MAPGLTHRATIISVFVCSVFPIALADHGGLLPATAANTTADPAGATRQLQDVPALACNLPSLVADVNADCCGGSSSCGHRRLQMMGLSCAVPDTCSLQCASTFVYFMNACGPTLEMLGMAMDGGDEGWGRDDGWGGCDGFGDHGWDDGGWD